MKSSRVERVLAQSSRSQPGVLFTASTPWPEDDFSGPGLDSVTVVLGSSHARQRLQAAIDLGLGMPVDLMPQFKLVRPPGEKLFRPAFRHDRYDLLVPGEAAIEQLQHRRIPAVAPVGVDELQLGITPEAALAASAFVARWWGPDLIVRICALAYNLEVSGVAEDAVLLDRMHLPPQIERLVAGMKRPALLAPMLRRFALDSCRLAADPSQIVPSPRGATAWFLGDVRDPPVDELAAMVLRAAWCYQTGALGLSAEDRSDGWMQRAVAQGLIGDLVGVGLVRQTIETLEWKLARGSGSGERARRTFREAVKRHVGVNPESLPGLAAVLTMAMHPSVDHAPIMQDPRVQALAELAASSALKPRQVGEQLVAHHGGLRECKYGELPPSWPTALIEHPFFELDDRIAPWGPDLVSQWASRLPEISTAALGVRVRDQDIDDAFEDAVVAAVARLRGVRDFCVTSEAELRTGREALVSGGRLSERSHIPDTVATSDGRIVAFDAYRRRRSDRARDGEIRKVRVELQKSLRKHRRQIAGAGLAIRAILQHLGRSCPQVQPVGLVVLEEPLEPSVATVSLDGIDEPLHTCSLHELHGLIDAAMRGLGLAGEIARWQAGGIGLPLLTWSDEFGAGRFVNRDEVAQRRVDSVLRHVAGRAP